MTSYPKKFVQYPMITLKIINIERKRAGMQTTNEDIKITLEIRIWARSEKEKDTLYDKVINRIDTIQFTTTTGSTAQGLYDYNSSSAVELEEEGDGDQIIKSRIIKVTYNFFG